jgi:spore germination protein YaaH
MAQHRRMRSKVSAVLMAGGAVTVVAVLALLVGIARSPGPPSPEESPVADPGRPLVIGYVPYWDQERSLDVVWEQSDLLDEISPVWYSLEPTGEVVLADDVHVTVDTEAVEEARNLGVRVIPTVTNLRNGEWDAAAVQAVLRDPELRSAHVDELVELAITEGYDGIDVDYEHLEAADREAFTDFLTDLANRLQAEDKVLTVALHAKTSDEGYAERNEAQDYQAIGRVADQVRVMTYDYSWENSPPGPVAPRDWVDEVLEWTVTQIPPEKVILGIVLLGYDWVNGQGITINYNDAMARSEEYDAPVQRSDDGSPWLTYQSAHGNQHEIWFEDAVSVQAKLELVSEYNLGGVFFWRLGGEDANVWRQLPSALDEP